MKEWSRNVRFRLNLCSSNSNLGTLVFQAQNYSLLHFIPKLWLCNKTQHSVVRIKSQVSTINNNKKSHLRIKWSRNPGQVLLYILTWIVFHHGNKFTGCIIYSNVSNLSSCTHCAFFNLTKKIHLVNERISHGGFGKVNAPSSPLSESTFSSTLKLWQK